RRARSPVLRLKRSPLELHRFNTKLGMAGLIGIGTYGAAALSVLRRAQVRIGHRGHDAASKPARRTGAAIAVLPAQALARAAERCSSDVGRRVIAHLRWRCAALPSTGRTAS